MAAGAAIKRDRLRVRNAILKSTGKFGAESPLGKEIFLFLTFFPAHIGTGFLEIQRGSAPSGSLANANGASSPVGSAAADRSLRLLGGLSQALHAAGSPAGSVRG